MLKKRIAAVLVVREGIVVQSIGFSRYLPVGDPGISVEFLNDWGIDEIIFLGMDNTRKGRGPDFDLIRRISRRCRVPLTVGGGIRSVDDVRELLRCGADRVAFNHAAIHKPELLTETARTFGDQCVVASIDAVLLDGEYRVYDHSLGGTLTLSPAGFARDTQARGAGEILINSVHRDGSYRGFDIGLIRDVCEAVTVPVICCGGAGLAEHFVEAFSLTGASAVAAGNFLNFSEHSVATIKAQVSRSISIRHESHATYDRASFDARGRLEKKDDRELEEMLFLRIEKEVI